MADTGQGATLTLSTTGAIAAIRSMTLPEFTIDKLEDSDLSTTVYKTYIPTDLSEPGELSVEAYFDGTTALPARGVVETVTVTWPSVATTNEATLVGTGFITAVKVPDMNMGELQMMTITIAFDGKTDPAYTAET